MSLLGAKYHVVFAGRWPRRIAKYDTTETLIDLWSETTIQFALENSKTFKETREVYNTLQVSDTL